MKMKHKIVGGLLVAMTLLLSGCGGQKGLVATDLEEGCVNFLFGSTLYTDNYILSVDEAGRFVYKDLNAGTKAVLCAKANCTHEVLPESIKKKTREKDLCFADIGQFTCAFIDGDELYIAKMNDNMGYDIYYSDNIGISKEKIMNIEDINTITECDYNPDTKQWVLYYAVDYEKGEVDYVPLDNQKVGYVVVDLKNKTYKKYLEHEVNIYEKDKYGMGPVYINKDGLLYYKTYFDGSKEELDNYWNGVDITEEEMHEGAKKTKYVLCQYAFQTEQETELITISQDMILAFDRNILSYVDGEEFVCYDIQKKQEYRLEGYGAALLDLYDGEHIGFHMNCEEGTLFYVYDIATGEIDEVYHYEEENKGVNYLNYTKHNVFLCIYDEWDGQNSMDVKISIEDYLNGNFTDLKWEEPEHEEDL